MAEEQTADPQVLIDSLTRQVSDLSGKLTTAETARDGFQSRLRSSTHKQAFKDSALAARVDPKAVDALWRLSGYEPDSDDVSPEAIAGLVAKAREDSPYAFLKDEPVVVVDPNAPPAPLKKPIDTGRGKPPIAPSGKFQVTLANLSDGAWMQANQDKVQAAQKDGTFELVSS
jgi:hypothetical protein